MLKHCTLFFSYGTLQSGTCLGSKSLNGESARKIQNDMDQLVRNKSPPSPKNKNPGFIHMASHRYLALEQAPLSTLETKHHLSTFLSRL